MTLIDVRDIAAMMGRQPNTVWNYHRHSRDYKARLAKLSPTETMVFRRNVIIPMPDPVVITPDKLWDLDGIKAWINERDKARAERPVRRPSPDLRPSESRRYPAAAALMAKHVGINVSKGVAREFDSRPNYHDGTVTVTLTTRHVIKLADYQRLLLESQK